MRLGLFSAPGELPARDSDLVRAVRFGEGFVTTGLFRGLKDGFGNIANYEMCSPIAAAARSGI